MSNKVVLGASAFLALIQNEKWADVIKHLLNRAIMSTKNIAEVLTALQRVDILPKKAIVFITPIIKEIGSFDFEHAQLIAELQPSVSTKVYH